MKHSEGWYICRLQESHDFQFDDERSGDYVITPDHRHAIIRAICTVCGEIDLIYPAETIRKTAETGLLVAKAIGLQIDKTYEAQMKLVATLVDSVKFLKEFKI